MSFARSLIVLGIALALSACEAGQPTTVPTSRPSSPVPTPTATEPSYVGAIDPFVPYSPPPTPFREVGSGYLPDTLTLPTTGGGKLYVTPTTTTMRMAWQGVTRAFAVYLRVENPTDQPWTGSIGGDAEVVDEAGRRYPAELAKPGDLHPDAERYGGVNRNLLRPITIGPGDEMEGVILFHPTEGNRRIVLRISADGGTNWGEWETNLGVF
jgi:hypothetical protein